MNSYGIPEAEELKIRSRYTRCVYCRKKMKSRGQDVWRGDEPTLEHLNYLPPWNDPSTVVICCHSCNSRRGSKPLLVWFESQYCKDNNISIKTVPKEIVDYIRLNEQHS